MRSIVVRTDGAVARITLNRPDKLNALTIDAYRELGEALAAFANMTTIRVIVLSGAGRAFAAGADIDQYVGMSADGLRAFIDTSRETVDRFAACPQPIVAAVHGFAIGGGFELVLACDLVIAAENARFGLPEATLGLLPGGGGTQRLTRLVGRLRANELIMTGRLITAAEAMSWGLVNRLCAVDEMGLAIDEMVDSLIAVAPAPVAIAKGLIATADDDSLADGLRREAEATAPLIETPDGIEGVAAFVAKRRPSFGR